MSGQHNCEKLMYIYVMNGLFIWHKFQARDVLNILEYKPSLKQLRKQSTGRLAKNNVYLLLTNGVQCVEGSRVLGIEVGCRQYHVVL